MPKLIIESDKLSEVEALALLLMHDVTPERYGVKFRWKLEN